MEGPWKEVGRKEGRKDQFGRKEETTGQTRQSDPGQTNHQNKETFFFFTRTMETRPGQGSRGDEPQGLAGMKAGKAIIGQGLQKRQKVKSRSNFSSKLVSSYTAVK